MYENVNTAERANAMPAFPSFKVIPAPASTSRTLSVALGRCSTNSPARTGSNVGRTSAGEGEQIAKLRTIAIIAGNSYRDVEPERLDGVGEPANA